MSRLSKITARLSRVFVALAIVGAQAVPAILAPGRALAAGQITFGSQFQNQTFPDDPNTWTNGQLDNYSEGDYVNFRFQLTATDDTSAGTMLINFDKGSCNFFTDYFEVKSVTPSIATVTEGAQTESATMYTQLLDVQFNTTGTTTVVVTLQLSNTAGDCTGSSTGVRLGVPENNGDFDNTGAKNLPLSANDILENPSLTITKTVASGTALPSDFYFTVSPAVNGQTAIRIPAGNNSVTVNEVNPDGQFVITEHGPAGYTFSGGTGTSCSVNASTLNTASGAMTATVTADNDDPIDATCNFTNRQLPGSITIVKDAVPNHAQDFNFTVSGQGLTNFILDDDNGATGANTTYSNTKVFDNLMPGSYTITETTDSGWDLTNLVCGNTTITGPTATINLTAGQNITCTYTNKLRGQIIVNKVTEPAGDTTNFPIAISPTSGVTAPTSLGIVAGTPQTFSVAWGQSYSVNEDLSNLPSWVQKSNTCTGLTINTSTPTVNGVPTLNCTITNTKQANLTIIKNATPKSLQDFAFTTSANLGNGFTLDDDSGVAGADNIYSNTKTFSNIVPGQTYTVTENGEDGWTLNDITCEGGAVFDKAASRVTFIPTPGQSASCTFFNIQYSSISGVKWLVNADGSTVDNPATEEVDGTTLTGWVIELLQDGQVVDSANTDTNGAYTFDELLPGNYTVREVQEDGYTQIVTATEPCMQTNYVINLLAGQTLEGYDFCNFQNGNITGSKWNDVDGDSAWDESEPGLAGWTIELYNIVGAEVPVATTVTAADGSYSFSNVAPGSYLVCEVQQTGWLQTYPSENNGCHAVNITETDQGVGDRSFGNQGRGTIKVIKKVDTNGDGVIDNENATDWTWDINGNGNYATGSAQNVAAGTYIVSEDQKPGYHVTHSSCSNDAPLASPVESMPVTVNPGQDVVCTFTNTRDTGTLIVVKELINDNSGQSMVTQFSYRIDAGQPVFFEVDGSNSHTLVSGTYDVEEVAAEGYTTSYSNSQNQLEDCQNLVVYNGQTVTCTITNDDVAHPDIEIRKSGPAYAYEGDSVVYRYEIENTGDAPLVVTDFLDDVTGEPQLIAEDDGSISGDTNGNYVLDPGEIWLAEDAYIVPTPRTDNVVNTVEVCGIDVTGIDFVDIDEDNWNEWWNQAENDVCDTDTHTLDVLHPALNVVKSGPATANTGTTVTYTFTVTNTGDVDLSVQSVMDSIAGAGVYKSGDSDADGKLDLTEVWIYQANYTIPMGQTADVVNTVTVCAVDTVGGKKTCDDDQHTLKPFTPQVLGAVTTPEPPRLVVTGSISGLLQLIFGVSLMTLTAVLAFSRKQAHPKNTN